MTKTISQSANSKTSYFFDVSCRKFYGILISGGTQWHQGQVGLKFKLKHYGSGITFYVSDLKQAKAEDFVKCDPIFSGNFRVEVIVITAVAFTNAIIGVVFE